MASGEFRVSKAGRAEAERLIFEEWLFRLKNTGMAWTVESYQAALATRGVDWNTDQIKRELETLYKSGFIEDVVEIKLAPEPEPVPIPSPGIEVSPE